MRPPPLHASHLHTSLGNLYVSASRPSVSEELSAAARSYLLVAGQASVDGGVDDPVQAHGEGVDVLHLPVLALGDQRAQLQVLVLDHLDGVLQRAHLHLRG